MINLVKLGAIASSALAIGKSIAAEIPSTSILGAKVQSAVNVLTTVNDEITSHLNDAKLVATVLTAINPAAGAAAMEILNVVDAVEK